MATDMRRALAPDRSSEPYTLAADFIEGRDPFGMAFIEAYRAGAAWLTLPATAMFS